MKSQNSDSIPTAGVSEDWPTYFTLVRRNLLEIRTRVNELRLRNPWHSNRPDYQKPLSPGIKRAMEALNDFELYFGHFYRDYESSRQELRPNGPTD